MVGEEGYRLSYLADERMSILLFSTFKDSLFEANQSLMFTSSLFTTVKRCLMSLWFNKRLVSSTNIAGSNNRDAFGRMETGIY